MPPVGFEPTISEGERPQTYAIYSNIQQYTAIYNLNINEESVAANKAFGKCGLFKGPNRHYTIFYDS